MPLKCDAGGRCCTFYGRTNISIPKELAVPGCNFPKCRKKIISYDGFIAWKNVKNLGKLVAIVTLDGRRVRGFPISKRTDGIVPKHCIYIN